MPQNRRATTGTLLAVAVVAASVSLGAQSAADVTVREAWIREATTAQPSTAAYLIVENKAPRAAVLVGVNTAVAGAGELHTMTMKQSGAMPGMGGMDMMTMEKVDEVVIPGGTTVELKPGGVHVMFFRIAKAIAVGETVSLKLEFKDGSERTVTAKVQSRASTGYEDK